jgi:hypothetical protein
MDADQPRNGTFSTSAKLSNRARKKLVRLALRHGVGLRNPRLSKVSLIQH